MNFQWKFHVNRNWICKLRTLWSVQGLETHVGDFKNYNHLFILSFPLMNNISITIETHVESWVGVAKLDVQCDHRLLLPLTLIATAIGRLNYGLIFLSVYPIHMTLLLKDLRCFHIALSSCRVSFSWCPKLHNQVNWDHMNKETSFAFWYYQRHFHWDLW